MSQSQESSNDNDEAGVPTRETTPSAGQLHPSNGTKSADLVSGDERLRSKLYQHEQLPSDDNIRILKLHPGSGDEPLTCELQIVHIESCPNYTAISYTWATKRPLRPILVRSRDVRSRDDLPATHLLINDTLFELLAFLRKPAYECTLWIDSICIDQARVEERNHQVQLMGRVYSQANYVIAAISSTEDYPGLFRSSVLKFMSTASSTKTFQPFLKSNLRRYTGAPVEWKQFRDFCSLKYWSRKWIIQEIIAARSVVLQYGQAMLPMSVVEDFVAHLESVMKDPEVQRSLEYNNGAMPSSARLLAQHRLCKRYQTTTPSQLHRLMALYSANKCSVSSDHVYALVNLVGDHKGMLEVDYHQDAMSQTVSTLKFLQLYDGLPTSLTMSYASNLLLKLAGNPSWAKLLSHQFPTTYFRASVRQFLQTHRKGETTLSQHFRNSIKPLYAFNDMTFFGSKTKDHLVLVKSCADVDMTGRSHVTPPDMIHLQVGEMSALADVYREGDFTWQFLCTGTGFIVRPCGQDQEYMQIVGRAVLFSDKDAGYKSTRPLWSSIGIEPFALDAALEVDLQLPADALLQMAKAAARFGATLPRYNLEIPERASAS